jgi:class 3 adenylate cyclase/tetratricopeptide (TPR) repeat protein
VDCAKCGRTNPDDAAFCSRCGTPLTERCANCGRVNPPAALFCTGCGDRLAGDEPQVRERRYLTVMFCDLVDSTRLAGELDPEDMRDLVAAYQRVCASAIAEHSGFLARYLGDGVLAYFGYPEAHEDDARLAVTAALAIAGAAEDVRRRCGRTDIDVRIGLHTGEVVVTDAGGRDGRHQHEIVGETPNVAARLQSATSPGSVVISDRTRALVEGFFAFEDLGELTLKGVRRPVPAFRVTGTTDARTRLDAVATRGLTPFVGRDPELAELVEHWEAVAGGSGRVVLLSGEPGIGKSRLAHEMCERATNGAVVRLRCSPYNASSTLFPFVEHFLKAVCGREPDPALRLQRLETRVAQLGLDAEATVPLIADLLAVPTAGRYPPTSDSPVRLKRRTLEALYAWVEARSANQPLLLVIEDVQWVDPTTLELLARYFGHEPVPGVLLLLTHRAEFLPQWVHRAHVNHLPLERLEAAAMNAMLAELTGGRQLPAEVRAEIGARTDGIPLFVEEVTHAVLDSGWEGTLPERLVPSTLRESLLARLDGLGEARAVAQVLSVVGSEASFELLREASELDEGELESGLERLEDTDLVRRHHSPAGTTYALKHWLIQDVAYESLLRSTRRRYHGRIAESLPTEVVDTQPEFVAHHLLEAARDGDAIVYLRRAGELAHRRSASTEAIAHLTRALELVRRQPESADRRQLELELLIALGAPLTAAKGYSVPEVEEVYTRAAELCRAAGDVATPQFFRALYGTWRVHLLRADYTRAMEFAGQLLRLAELSGNATQAAAAHRALGSTLFYLGEDPSAHLEIVIGSTALERSRMSFIEELHDVVDPWITCHAYQAWALWLAGRAGEARVMSDRALALGTALGHPFTRTLTLSFDAWLCQWEGDVAAVRERAQDALALAREQGFEFWIGWNEVMLGWALGDLDAMRRGLADWRAVGSELGTTYFFALMAEACRDAGRLDDARETLEAADEVAARTGEGFWASDIARLRNDLFASAS